jgi:hypothetical protein
MVAIGSSASEKHRTSGPADSGRFTPCLAAEAVHDRALVLERFGLGPGVPHRGMPRCDGHRAPFAGTADEDTQIVARELLDGRIEQVESLSRLRKVQSERPMFGLVPTRSEAQHEPSVADLIKRSRHLAKHWYVSVRHAEHQRSQADPLG